MVKGIDNQIMIHRTAEYARQTAARNDHAENAREFAAQMEQQRALHDGQSVGETEKAGKKTVGRDNNGAPKEHGENEKRENSGQGESAEDERKAAGPDTLGTEIDITI